jgi:hypothetical protein
MHVRGLASAGRAALTKVFYFLVTGHPLNPSAAVIRHGQQRA